MSNKLSEENEVISLVKKSIRKNIESGEITLNRPGAMGWISDNKLWVVVNRMIDLLRIDLRLDGLTISSKNLAFLKILSKHGLIESVDDERYQHRIVVRHDNDLDSQQYACLCFPLARFWNDEDSKPTAIFNADLQVLPHA